MLRSFEYYTARHKPIWSRDSTSTVPASTATTKASFPAIISRALPIKAEPACVAVDLLPPRYAIVIPFASGRHPGGLSGRWLRPAVP